jgi:hypothetical protein
LLHSKHRAAVGPRQQKTAALRRGWRTASTPKALPGTTLTGEPPGRCPLEASGNARPPFGSLAIEKGNRELTTPELGRTLSDRAHALGFGHKGP